MKWEISSELRLLEGYASQYKDPIEALYELGKNLEDEGATEIYIEFDSKNLRLYVYGNGNGMTLDKFNYMVCNIGKSSKGERNFGVGLIGFLRIGSHMHMLSKNHEKIFSSKYIVGSCFRKNDQLWSEPDPHYLEKEEMEKYDHLIKKLHKWNSGTITVIDGVGKSNSAYYPMNFGFDEKKGFGKTRVENMLIKRIRQKLAHIKYFMIYDGNRVLLNKKASLRTGKDCVAMTIPSLDYPFVNTQGEKRYSFKMNGYTYEIETKMRAEVKTDSSNVLSISFHGQDALDCQTACRDLYNLPKSSIFRGNEYTKYIDGWIDMTIKSDAGPIPNVYSLNRNSLNFDEPVAKIVTNILWFIEEAALTELVSTYVNQMKKNKNQAASIRLNQTMHALYKRFPEVFSTAINTKNRNPVPQPSKTKCKACKFEAIPVNGKIQSRPKKEDKIIHDSAAEKYQCLRCGEIWSHRPYTAPIRTEKFKKNKPFYNGTFAEKERQRRRGFGYLFEVQPLHDDTERRFAIAGTQIIVNTNHPEHKLMTKRYKSYKDPIHRYENKMAVLAVVSNNEDIKDVQDLWPVLEEAMACLDVAEAEGLIREDIDPERDQKEIQNIEQGEKLARKWGTKLKT